MKIKKFNESKMSSDDIKDEFLAIKDVYDVDVEVENVYYSEKENKIVKTDMSISSDEGYRNSYMVKIPILSDRILHFNSSKYFVNQDMFKFVLTILSNKDFDYRISLDEHKIYVLIILDEIKETKNTNGINFVKEFDELIRCYGEVKNYISHTKVDKFAISSTYVIKNKIIISFDDLSSKYYYNRCSNFVKSTFMPDTDGKIELELKKEYDELIKKWNVKPVVKKEFNYDRCEVTFIDL